MPITPEHVADLMPGDVVRLAGHTSAHGATIEGPLYLDETGRLCVGPGLVVRQADGAPNSNANLSLAIVSKAERPMYVNHPRVEPVKGDVFRSAEIQNTNLWMFAGKTVVSKDGDIFRRGELPADLHLLIDGETNEVVP
jgi:hypothetical protein